MRELNLINHKYNMLTVISLDHEKNNSNYWLCECECGKKTVVSTHNLRTSGVKSCGCLTTTNGFRRRDNLLGKVFAYLTVVDSIYDEEKKQLFWLCKCRCGNEKLVRTIGAQLKTGKTKSCGCFRRGRLEYGESAFNRLFDTYRRRSLEKGFSFDLSKEEFREMTSENCFYCGLEPKQKAAKGMGICYGEYLYNGIDRIDSKKGYSKDNIVPCCGQCNVAKNDYSYEEFLIWAKRLSGNLSANNEDYKDLRV